MVVCYPSCAVLRLLIFCVGGKEDCFRGYVLNFSLHVAGVGSGWPVGLVSGQGDAFVFPSLCLSYSVHCANVEQFVLAI